MTPNEQQQLGRIEQMVRDAQKDIGEIKVDVKTGFKDMNGRVRILEYWKIWVVGISVGLVFAINYLKEWIAG